jgi:hypothetical protein
MRKPIVLAFLLMVCSSLSAQENKATRERYLACLDSIKIILERNLEFKRAVFMTENCYITGMNYGEFDRRIKQLASIAKAWEYANPISNYQYSDSTNFWQNFSIFRLLKDTIRIVLGDHKEYHLFPYTYEFNDFSGNTEWSNMFVTKLLATHKGNCHSLPYLYKILADELGASCWLALAPNHIYIENRCRKIGWYNTELTSGCFPIDAWIMASGYLPVKAVQSGIYMDTLSNQESIALCILDLAKGYEHQTHNFTDGFILKCCDLSIRYFPLNVQAILLKAETLKRIYEKQKYQKSTIAKETYLQMEQLYVKLFDLGYREMPDKMYQQWLGSVVKEKDKYSNKEVKGAIQGNRN